MQLSLLIHMLLLSLAFDGEGLGLPGFGFPWQVRRAEVPDLRVVILPRRVAPAERAIAPVAESPQRAGVEQRVANRRDVMAPPSIPKSAGIDLPRSDAARLVVPAPLAAPVSVIAPAPSDSSPEIPPPRDAGDEARAPIDEEARERAIDLAKLDLARQEAQRQAEQVEAALAETARLEAERQEAARQAAARQEAARQEAARQEAALQETARQEAARQEAARQESARAEAQEWEARREAARRALGRQLDEEAARRQTASSAERLPLSLSSARRARLFGRSDPNAELILYAEAWSRKIQMNMTFDMVREAAKLPHTNPMVTVAIRSDGSVESVTFVVSSGVAAMDEAVRRIVYSQEHYPAFPPDLAREFDVIEIRRTWHFDVAIRLY